MTPEDRAYEILGTRCYCPVCGGGTCHYCLVVAAIRAAVIEESARWAADGKAILDKATS